MQLNSSDKKDFLEGWILLVVAEHPEKMEMNALKSLYPWSQEDSEHFSRIGNQNVRTSWCVGRLLQSSILSELLSIEPENLSYEYGAYGKPFISGCDVNFNLSHTSGCVVLAVSAHGGIGCDIEMADQSVSNFRLISNTFFSNSEKSWIEDASDEKKRVERFLALFAEKEAVIKASGSSLWKHLSETRGTLAELPHAGLYTSVFKHGSGEKFIIAVNSLKPIGGRIKILFHETSPKMTIAGAPL